MIDAVKAREISRESYRYFLEAELCKIDIEIRQALENKHTHINYSIASLTTPQIRILNYELQRLTYITKIVPILDNFLEIRWFE